MSAPDPAAQFALEAPVDLLKVMTGDGVIEPRISRAEALQVPEVMRARNIICGTLATLPFRYIGPNKQVVEWPLVDHPDPEIPQSVTWAYTFEDLLFEGVSWWRVTRFGPGGWPVEARHVPRTSVTVSSDPYPPSQTQITPDQPFGTVGTVYIDGMPVPDREIIRFDSPNPPLLTHAARSIRTALRLEQTTRLYSEDPLPLSHFEQADGADPLSMEPHTASDGSERSEVEEFLDSWAAARKKRSTAYVAAMKLVKDQWDPKQLQLVEARDQAAKKIATACGLDPEDIAVSVTSRSYQNVEQRRQDMKAFTLGAYVQAVQERLSMRDVAQRRHVVRVGWEGFLRSDTLTRMQAYEMGRRVGAYADHDEVRDLEDKPPLTSAQRESKRQAAAPATQEDETAMQLPPIHSPVLPAALKFSNDDEPVRVTFEADDIETFQVDMEKRTIIGLAVPWGKVARSGFYQWKFAEGSLHWTNPSRVKLNLNHDFAALIGRATRLQSSSRGLQATYKIANTPEGDKALALAADEVLDGFSVEVDFVDEAGDSWQPDPTDERVRLVTQASLRGTALTGMPAFDDARVARVTASRKGPTVPENKQPTPGDGQGAGTVALEAGEFTNFMSSLAKDLADSHKNLTEELGQSIGESVSAGFKSALENIHDPQKDGPEPVRAARFAVTREAPVYTFDGRGASLVRDAWYAQREHDDEARDRIRKFHNQAGEMQKLVSSHVAFTAGQMAQFATVTTGTASEVIPPGYRPDLFVPQLAQGRPLYNMLSRGTIANATPFVVPTFGSASGMTGDHTEGAQPTEGTLTLGSETVTPGAISGKLPLTREIVDSSNPAIDQIALAAMREDYARQTEQKVFAALNGAAAAGNTASLSDATLGDGSTGDDVAISPTRDLLSRYPFVRFAAPNGAAIGQKVTRNFANAKDSTGRPLLPSVGADNTSGIGNAVTQGWSVDGLPFVPAWAITENVGDDIGLVMNSSDAWAWESPVLAFRFEEKQGPEIIELALFGYFATHVLRASGVFALRLAA